MSPTRPSRRRVLLVAAPATALALTLTACGGSGAEHPATASTAGALDKATTLTFWTWTPNLKPIVAKFEALHPKIKINVVNAGQGPAEYTKLQTAIKAGTGGPDIAQVEYFALPEMALSKDVVNLNDYNVQSLKDKFTASAWSQVSTNGGVYGVPQDTGPLTMFYRTDVFKKLGLEAPKTWKEFAADAAKIHAADPTHYITAVDPGDAGVVDSLIWQAGGKPFQTSGSTKVSVNLKDAGATKVSSLWTSMLSKKLVDPTPIWTNEWWQGMSSGKYATWIAGAWAPGSIASTIPQTAGKWAAAPVPQWEAGGTASAENGGSSNAVPVTSKNKAAAVAFAEWLNSDPTATKALADGGLFPATSALLKDPAFLNKKIAVLGDQQANQVYAASSAQVTPGWQYLPFQVYANSVFKDTAGQSISAGTDLSAGLTAWQKRIADYGNRQGFTVTGG
ncbi:ABC transporter substrate-binding protein [Streptomyces sp. YS-B37]|uniref:ABC transporter substrate-binding protein n=1 Tax=Streptomyces sp. YS-B37 TaxID=3407669 RepID=UPI003B5069CC